MNTSLIGFNSFDGPSPCRIPNWDICRCSLIGKTIGIVPVNPGSNPGGGLKKRMVGEMTVSIDQKWVNDMLSKMCPEWRWRQLESERLSHEELQKEIEWACSRYDQRRKIASTVLQHPGMEEAFIDELESMGFRVTPEDK